ncbi:MAG: RHS repeat domain-containing protein, partial [Bacteroidales bacterium]
PDWNYEYDLLGNLTSKTSKSGLEQWTYEWNEAGMLTKVVSPNNAETRFKYDALSRRIEKQHGSTTTRWVWDGNTPLHEWTLEDRSDLITWVFEEGTFVPQAKLQHGKSYSIITDHLGTPIQAYDEFGTKIWSRSLDIYGKVRSFEGDKTFLAFLFAGIYEDIETGLCYNRFRYYDPEMGMYISQDPIGLASGEFNLYSYVKDSNIWIDPFGLLGSLTEMAKSISESGDHFFHRQ